MLINKKLLVLFNLILCIATVALAWNINQKNTPKLNLVLISIDTLRPDHMGIYGYRRNTTPNIDKYFQKGFILNNVYTETPKTYASIVTMLTGRRPSTTKIFDYVGRPLQNKEFTLAQILKSSGYDTAAFITNGALYSNADGFRTGLQKGFNLWSFLPGSEKFLKQSYFYDEKTYRSHFQKAANWIRKSKKSKPFFLWAHLFDPHAPYNPPLELTCNFNEQLCSKSTDYLKYRLEEKRSLVRGSPRGCSVNQPISTQTVNTYQDLYDADISYSDQIVETILQSLKATGHDQDTIVVITADHGEGFDHDYYFHHGNLYNSNIRIPLLIYHPRLMGYQVDRQFTNADLLPTLLELLNLPKLDKIDGVSFAGMLKFPLTSNLAIGKESRIVYGYNHDYNFFSAMQNGYKYLYSPKKNCLFSGKNEELYNLHTDPLELNNLIDQQPQTANKLRTVLFNKLRQENIPFE